MRKAIPVTRQELARAWRHLHEAANVSSRRPPHLLLVFYAVECGLKAVWLRRHAKEVLEGQDIEHLGHDLNQLFKELRVGHSLVALPAVITLKPLGKAPRLRTRSGGVDVLHQAWRYGIEVQTPDVALVGKQLDGLNQWIAKELQ